MAQKSSQKGVYRIPPPTVSDSFFNDELPVEFSAKAWTLFSV